MREREREGKRERERGREREREGEREIMHVLGVRLRWVRVFECGRE